MSSEEPTWTERILYRKGLRKLKRALVEQDKEKMLKALDAVEELYDIEYDKPKEELTEAELHEILTAILNDMERLK